jgi:tetratricopeptide (TPR) repeat protein
LREPVDHQLSLYNYRMMNHLNKGLGTYSFDLHVRAQQKDWVTHRLLGEWLEIPGWRLAIMSDTEKYAVLNRMLAEFWFVGSYADCARVIAAIASDLGLPPDAPERNTARQWLRQIYWEPLTAEALGPRKRQALSRRNPIDTALWKSWRSAGFDTATVRPRPLEGAGRYRFAAYEPTRRVFLAARRFRRDYAPRWVLFRPSSGLRSGFEKADLAFYSRQWRLAAAYYRQGLAEEPRAPAIWVQYGHALRLCGEVEEAERAYREALHREPDNANTHIQLGHVLALQGRAAAAAEAYRQALTLDEHAEEAAAGLRSLELKPVNEAARGSGG